MTAPDPAAAAMTWPGICHNLDIAGHPAAGEVTLDNGIPVAHLTVGTDLAGGDAVLDIASLAVMDELVREVLLMHSRLALWHNDHRMHPFGEAAA